MRQWAYAILGGFAVATLFMAIVYVLTYVAIELFPAATTGGMS